MKKLTSILFFAVMISTASAQFIGGNGEGLTKKYDAVDVEYLSAAPEIVICFPGGADAKFNESRLDRPGLGMQRQTVVDFNAEFAKNENGESNLTKDLQDLVADSLESRSYLYDMREIQVATSCRLIWKANVFVDPAVVVRSVQDFQSIGGVIDGFSIGNELYFVLNFDGERYIEMVDALVRLLKQTFPTIPIALNYAQGVTATPHIDFNRAVENYIIQNPGLVDAVDTHPYLNDNDFEYCISINPCQGDGKKDVNAIPFSYNFNDSLSAAFDAYNFAWKNSTVMKNCFDTINSHLPGIEIWTTEFGDIPVLLFGNTISNGASYFYKWTEFHDRVKYFCGHNLVGGFHWAFLYNHEPHVQYYAMKLAAELITNEFGDLYEVNTIQSSGTHYFRFINTTGSGYDFTVTTGSGIAVDSVVVEQVHAGWNYATSGESGFYQKKTDPGQDVFYQSLSEQYINGYSFGYVKVVCSDVAVEIAGCTDATACNYDPDATVDNGSCVYRRRFMFFRWCPRVKSTTSKPVDHV